jgi:hypothetical protein
MVFCTEPSGGGKLLLYSNGVTLLPLLATFNPLPIFPVTVPLLLLVTALLF